MSTRSSSPLIALDGFTMPNSSTDSDVISTSAASRRHQGGSTVDAAAADRWRVSRRRGWSTSSPPQSSSSRRPSVVFPVLFALVVADVVAGSRRDTPVSGTSTEGGVVVVGRLPDGIDVDYRTADDAGRQRHQRNLGVLHHHPHNERTLPNSGHAPHASSMMSILHDESPLRPSCLPMVVVRPMTSSELRRAVARSAGYYDFRRSIYVNGSRLSDDQIDLIDVCGDLGRHRHRRSWLPDECRPCGGETTSSRRTRRHENGHTNKAEVDEAKRRVKRQQDLRELAWKQCQDSENRVYDSLLCKPILVREPVNIHVEASRTLCTNSVVVERCPSTLNVCEHGGKCVAKKRVDVVVQIFHYVGDLNRDVRADNYTTYNETECACEGQHDADVLPASSSTPDDGQPERSSVQQVTSESTPKAPSDNFQCPRFFKPTCVSRKNVTSGNQTLDVEGKRCVNDRKCLKPTCDDRLVYDAKAGTCLMKPTCSDKLVYDAKAGKCKPRKGDRKQRTKRPSSSSSSKARP